jgi:hypothetical protein
MFQQTRIQPHPGRKLTSAKPMISATVPAQPTPSRTPRATSFICSAPLTGGPSSKPPAITRRRVRRHTAVPPPARAACMAPPRRRHRTARGASTWRGRGSASAAQTVRARPRRHGRRSCADRRQGREGARRRGQEGRTGGSAPPRTSMQRGNGPGPGRRLC